MGERPRLVNLKAARTHIADLMRGGLPHAWLVEAIDDLEATRAERDEARRLADPDDLAYAQELSDQRDEALRALTTATRRAEEAEAGAAVLRGALQSLWDSLEEYVRQSMYHNPEWRSGIVAAEQALATTRGAAGRALLAEVEALRGVEREARGAVRALNGPDHLRDALAALDRLPVSRRVCLHRGGVDCNACAINERDHLAILRERDEARAALTLERARVAALCRLAWYHCDCPGAGEPYERTDWLYQQLRAHHTTACPLHPDWSMPK